MFFEVEIWIGIVVCGLVDDLLILDFFLFVLFGIVVWDMLWWCFGIIGGGSVDVDVVFGGFEG